jgi:AmmeMemoRadiSam system protein A
MSVRLALLPDHGLAADLRGAGRASERGIDLTGMQTLDEIGLSLPRVAREAIRAWLAGHGREPLETGSGPAAPVFVTLRTENGMLRGCIGTLRATQPNVVMETARSAVLAASEDPRFDPVRPREFDALRIEVSVLMPEEPVSGLDELDPAQYGVVVRDDHGRHGVLLPAIEGIDDAATQVSIARRKAHIAQDAAVHLARFRIRKYVG